VSQDPLHLLCVEPRFPGRLGAVADWLVRRRGYRCRLYCSSADGSDYWPASVGKGLEVIRYNVAAAGSAATVDWTRFLERGLAQAMGAHECIDARRPRPIDLVLGRTANLGSTLFVPVSLPGVPVVNYFDYFYHPHAYDLAEEADPDLPITYYLWRRAANAMDLLDLENGVTPWTATAWQRDLYPREYHGDFLVLHDGIDEPPPRPGPGRPRTVAGRTLPPEVRVVSFVARATDRVRGFDRFLTLANRLLRARPDILCVVVGGPVVQRGFDVRFYQQDYRAHLLRQIPLHDPSRVWFLDHVRPAVVAELLSVSDLHVYPSRPYPVARSLLEALASGCVVLAADTAPVREVVTHGETGLLVPPEDSDAWAQQALAVLADAAAHRPLGEAAAERVRQRYSRDVTLPQLAEHFTRLAGTWR
jgi:glycosyltransferase involved in cell wall biosynthesis